MGGSGAPGRRSVAQSYGQWGGRDRASSLLNKWASSWNTGDTKDMSGGLGGMVADVEAEWRQWQWQTVQRVHLSRKWCPGHDVSKHTCLLYISKASLLLHHFQGGDFVLIKSLEKESLSPRWKGPYQVLMFSPVIWVPIQHHRWKQMVLR